MKTLIIEIKHIGTKPDQRIVDIVGAALEETPEINYESIKILPASEGKTKREILKELKGIAWNIYSSRMYNSEAVVRKEFERLWKKESKDLYASQSQPVSEGKSKEEIIERLSIENRVYLTANEESTVYQAMEEYAQSRTQPEGVCEWKMNDDDTGLPECSGEHLLGFYPVWNGQKYCPFCGELINRV